jgi:hypothetical protein
MKKSIAMLAVLILALNTYAQQVFTVTKTTDPNPFDHPFNNVDSLCDPEMYGTLQWAINKVNNNLGSSIINFNIPYSGKHTIHLNQYLPQINVNTQVTIDGTSQQGYQNGSPMIEINGGGNLDNGLNIYRTEVIIKGLHINDFKKNGIGLKTSHNSQILNNTITNIVSVSGLRFTTPAAAIKVGGSNNVLVKSNNIGYDYSAQTAGPISDYGIFVEKSANCLFGGSADSLANHITNCKYGVFIYSGDGHTISQNTIYNNTNKAIYLGSTANQGITPPIISSYDGTLRGTAQAFSEVQIFGSTGTENANKYLATVSTNSHGMWLAPINTRYRYFTATVTDSQGNTSVLSNSMENTQLSTSLQQRFQNADSIEFDQFLYAYTLPEALQYEFNVQQLDSGINETIIKDVPYFTLNELSSERLYGMEYQVKVRGIYENDTCGWGSSAIILTVDNKTYKYGTVIGYINHSRFRLNSWNSAMGSIANFINDQEIINLFNKLDITEITRIYNENGVLQNTPLINYVQIQFSVHFNTDSAILELTNSQLLNHSEKCTYYKNSINDPYLTTSSPCLAYDCNNCYQYSLNSTFTNDYFSNFDDNDQPITIAVIDDSFSFIHEDINNNLQINIGEIPNSILPAITDLNNNNIIEANELLNYGQLVYLGINSLSDLMNNQSFISDFMDGIDNDNNGFVDDIIGWDAGNNDNLAEPPTYPNSYLEYANHSFSHGTHVIGIAAAETNNNLGMASISYNRAKVIPVKNTTDNGEFTTLELLKALEFINSSNVKIVNMSFGTPNESQAIEELINYGYNNNNIIHIAASGNDFGTVYNYPASYDNVVSISSCNINNQVSSFSTINDHVDFLAPGEDIISFATLGYDGYSCKDGTSMASPYITGLWAALLSKNNNLSFESVYNCISSTCTTPENYNPNLHGSGIVSPENAISCIIEQPLTPEIICEAEILCSDINYGFRVISTSGFPITYNWNCSNSNVLISNPTSSETSILFQSNGTYTISVEVCNHLNNCETTYLEIEINNIEVDVISSLPAYFCNGSSNSVLLTSNGQAPFSFSYDVDGVTNSGTSDNNIITIPVDQEGLYSITSITDEFGCEHTNNYEFNSYSQDCECQSNFNSNWAIGKNHILSFQNNTILNSGYTLPQISEAIASVSNENGELLFYTDGDKIMRGNGTYFASLPSLICMNNDILILPHPIDSRKYRIVVTEKQTTGIDAYLIKIEFDIPIGQTPLPSDPILPLQYETFPNQTDDLTERATWANRSTGVGYWVILSKRQTDGYIAYPFDINGDIETNLISDSDFGPTIASPTSPSTQNSGTLKYNENRNLLVATYYSSSFLRLYTFNNETGTMSLISELTTENPCYSAEFSPNGKYLYVTNEDGGIIRYIIDENLDMIMDQEFELDILGGLGDLQLAKNGYLYIKPYMGSCISAFYTPNEVDPNLTINTNCSIDGGSLSGYGLPQLLPERSLSVTPDVQHSCQPCTNAINLLVSGTGEPYLFNWSNGSTSSSLYNLCADNYNVTVTNAIGCNTISEIHIPTPLTAIISNVNGSCQGNNTGSFDVDVMGGIHPIDYVITDSEGNSIPNITGTVSNVPSGIYNIEISDINCSDFATVEINEIENPVIETIIENGACAGNNGSATAVVTNGSGTYTYLWDSGETTATATQLQEGINYVTVTDENGCFNTASVTIEDETPDSDFKPYGDPCQAVNYIPVEFEAITINQDWDYHWDFGDGNTATGYHADNTYEYYGYYCVTLTVTANGCSSSTSHTFFINPEKCACEASFNYDFNENIIHPNDPDMYEEEFYISGDLIISSYTDFQIQNSTLHFGPRARIILQPNASLTIKESTLTNLGSNCDYMWQGIETDFGSELNIIKSNIDNAHNGVYVGRKEDDCLCTGSNEYFPPSTNSNIYVEQSKFINCGTAIQDNFGTSSSPQATIRKSTFKTGVLLDPGYNLNHPDPYLYLENGTSGSRNPWAYKANTLQRGACGIRSKHRNYIISENNYFENLDNGMELHQTKFSDDNSEYKNTQYGIYIKPTFAFGTSNSVKNSTFNLHPGPLLNVRGAGIFARGSFGDRIENNTFGNELNINQADNDNGIVMYNASGYTILDNEFAKIRTAIRAINSGEGGGYIGIKDQYPWEYGNFFTLCNRNIYTIGDNSALKIRCNRCDNWDANLYEINFLNGGELATQGLLAMNWPGFSTLNPDRRPAGNQFEQNEGPGDYTYHEIKSTSDPYAYIHHNLDETVSDDPWRIMPKAEWNVGATHASVFLFESFHSHFDEFESCKPIYENDPYYYTMLIQTMGSALQLKDSISSILDNGNTTYLLDMISNHHSGDNLINGLIMNSPLSDTVLLSFISHDSVTNQEFIDVLSYNTPVSKRIDNNFYTRVSSLQNADQEKMWNLQVYNEDCATETSFLREYEMLNVLAKQTYSALIRTYTEMEDTTALISFLQGEHDNLSKELLFGIHLEKQDTLAVQSVLSNYQPATLQDSMWKEYVSIFANNLANGEDMYYLSRADKLFVTMLADHCEYGRANVFAQNLLSMLFGYEYEMCDNTTRSTMTQIEVVDEKHKNIKIGNAFPNPASKQVFVPYQCPNDMSVSIQVTDLTGRVIKTMALLKGESLLDLEVDSFTPGMYQIKFTFGNNDVHTAKFVKQ